MTEQTIGILYAYKQRAETAEAERDRALLRLDIERLRTKFATELVEKWEQRYHEVSDQHAATLDNRVYNEVNHATIGGVDFRVQI